MSADPTLTDRLRAANIQPAGAVLLAIGVVLVLAAYLFLPWFQGGVLAPSRLSFSDLHALLTAFRAQVRAQGIADHVSFATSLPYFDWLAWVLLLVSALAGGVAISPLGARFAIVRVLCSVIALCAAAATVFALDLFAVDQRAGNVPSPSFGDFLSKATIGAWTAVAGYVVIMIACLMPRPRRLRV